MSATAIEGTSHGGRVELDNHGGADCRNVFVTLTRAATGLVFDVGADRIEIGECLREPEREWLASVIQE